MIKVQHWMMTSSVCDAAMHSQLYRGAHFPSSLNWMTPDSKTLYPTQPSWAFGSSVMKSSPGGYPFANHTIDYVGSYGADIRSSGVLGPAAGSTFSSQFPPTPPKDLSASEQQQGGQSHGLGSVQQRGAASSPTSSSVNASHQRSSRGDYDVVKGESRGQDASSYMTSSTSSSSATPSYSAMTSAVNHHGMQPPYSYLAATDYATAGSLFNSAAMLKAASFARCRTKVRSTSGKCFLIGRLT